MVFHNAEVHLCIADQGNGAFCYDLVSCGVFKEKLLLIDGSGCKERSIHAIEEPFRSSIAGIADFLDGFYLVADTLIGSVAK